MASDRDGPPNLAIAYWDAFVASIDRDASEPIQWIRFISIERDLQDVLRDAGRVEEIR